MRWSGWSQESVHSITSTGWKYSFRPQKGKLSPEETLAVALLLISACATIT